MGNVSLKNGKVESILAKALWKCGIRYRKNYRNLPGSPDIAVTRYKIAVFVDGEFWHGYNWANTKKGLRRNREYWIQKIEENMGRDQRDTRALVELDWTVLRFRSSDVERNLNACLAAIIDCIDEKTLHGEPHRI